LIYDSLHNTDQHVSETRNSSSKIHKNTQLRMSYYIQDDISMGYSHAVWVGELGFG